MIRPSPRRRRRGYNLVEMLMAMFVFVAMMAVCMALIERLLKLDESGQAQAEATQTVARLARTLRDDVRGAEGLASTPPGSTPATPGPFDALTLTGPGDRAVEWAVEKGELTRLERAGMAVRQVDRFSLPAGQAGFRLDRSGTRTVIALVLDRRVGRGKALERGHARPLRIEAALGLDHRAESGATP